MFKDLQDLGTCCVKQQSSAMDSLGKLSLVQALYLFVGEEINTIAVQDLRPA